MWAIIVAVPLALSPAVFERVQSACGVETLTPTVVETPVLDAFNEQVAAYLRLQDAVRRHLALQRLFADPEDLFNAMRSMQAGIRAARPDARPGSMFTPAVSALIREGKTVQIPNIIQTQRKLGMETLNDALLNLVKIKQVEPDEAYNKSVEKKDMAMKLKAIGYAVTSAGQDD